MNPIHDVANKIKMPQETKEHILQGRKRHMKKRLWVPAAALGLLTVVILPAAGDWNGQKPIDQEVTPADHIVFNEADPLMMTDNRDSANPAVPVTEEELPFVRKISLPYAQTQMTMYRQYLYRDSLFLPKDEDFYAYCVFTSDQSDADRWLNLFVSQSAKRRPHQRYETELIDAAEMNAEPSSIGDTGVLLFRYEDHTEAYLTHEGWNFDIWAKRISDEELVECIRSIVNESIAITPGTLNILDGIQPKQIIETDAVPEKNGTQLYQEADLTAVIHIVSVDTCFMKDEEVYSGGYFTLYQSYSEELSAQSSRYIRKGGVLERNGEYTQYLSKGDSLVQPGCYLAYLKMTESGEYEIIGGPDGLRLLKEYVPSFDRNRLSFMNNRTGEYETIGEILPDLSDYHECFVN